MFTSNDYAIDFDTLETQIPFKNINAKGIDSVQIIRIDHNLIRTVFEFF